MRKKSVVFVTSQQMNSRNIERTQIMRLANTSLFTIFDLTKIFNPSSYSVLQEQFNLSFGLDIKIVSDYPDLRRHLNLYSHYDLFISWIGGNNICTKQLYTELGFLSHKTIILLASTFPKQWRDGSGRLIYRLLCKVRRERLYFLRSCFFYALTFPFYQIRGYKFAHRAFAGVITSGSQSMVEMAKYIGSNTVIYNTHSYDYVISQQPCRSLSNEKYFVFLDSHIVRHDDLLILNARFENEGIYYNEMNKFFCDFERVTGFKVIVAAHPRADSSYTQKMFPQHAVFESSTNCLVKHSSGCFTHFSTAVNFALFHHKPIIFLTSDRLVRRAHEIDMYASWFGRKPINISSGIPVGFKETFLESVPSPLTHDFISKYVGDFSQSLNDVYQQSLHISYDVY